MLLSDPVDLVQQRNGCFGPIPEKAISNVMDALLLGSAVLFFGLLHYMNQANSQRQRLAILDLKGAKKKPQTTHTTLYSESPMPKL